MCGSERGKWSLKQWRMRVCLCGEQNYKFTGNDPSIKQLLFYNILYGAGDTGYSEILFLFVICFCITVHSCWWSVIITSTTAGLSVDQRCNSAAPLNLTDFSSLFSCDFTVLIDSHGSHSLVFPIQELNRFCTLLALHRNSETPIITSNYLGNMVAFST